jgi:hypothetical protein
MSGASASADGARPTEPTVSTACSPTGSCLCTSRGATAVWPLRMATELAEIDGVWRPTRSRATTF